MRSTGAAVSPTLSCRPSTYWSWTASTVGRCCEHSEGSSCVPGPALTIEQRRALQLLAEAPNGMTDPAMRARGFSPTLLLGLVGAGYVVAKPQTMRAAA
jgi:hypothetical protein